VSKKNKERNLRRKVEILRAQVKTQYNITNPIRIESNIKTSELNNAEVRKALTKTLIFSISSFVLLAGFSFFNVFDLFTNLLIKR